METRTHDSRDAVERLAAEHPCYGEAAGRRWGRLHLPVAPHCNLGCNYCERTIGVKADAAAGPGSATEVLDPEAAARLTDSIAAKGWLRVAGIAGPGEPLANPATMETLRRVREAQPDVILCLSTNGLRLAEMLPQLLAIGLRALTVTINTTSPLTAAELYRWADLDGHRVHGAEAAAEVLARQWHGLRVAAEAGLLVKVNSVFVPGLNDDDLIGVAHRAAEFGVARHNIMPLIPRGRMRGHRAPAPEEVERVRSLCELWIPQFRGCVLCRADAIVPPLDSSGGSSCTVSACARPADRSGRPSAG
jgi:nitrogen fixation protein NifB